jgi:hypothetical protein
MVIQIAIFMNPQPAHGDRQWTKLIESHKRIRLADLHKMGRSSFSEARRERKEEIK